MTREDQFKDAYVAAFMASYKANEYTERCMRDEHDALRDHGIVEDAEHLAEYAWQAMVSEGLRSRRWQVEQRAEEQS